MNRKTLFIGTMIICLTLSVFGQNGGKNLPFTVNGVSFEMIFVKGGTFAMGCTSEQSDCGNDERPVHKVTLSDFYMGKYEVTQKLWQAVMGRNIRQQRDLVKGRSLYGEGGDFPVYYVSYKECEEFCVKLNELLANQLPDSFRFCIPTEAQWEYAARGGEKSKGYLFSGSNIIEQVAWFYENSDFETHRVGTKKKNELGIYDMSGNVWEWCQDWYHGNYYSTSTSVNPKGLPFGSMRILRGGSWDNEARFCRVSFRGDDAPSFRYDIFGLRLALIH